jgi:hypothetical protein
MTKHHCHSGECCSEENHHHHHNDGCCSHEHHHECEDFAHELLLLADEAWMEVLKEKIKDQIRQHNGAHLDALAKLVAESNNSRWKNKLDLQGSVREFKDQLSDFFKK